ncbi:hypothetical protein PENSPDRAFT_661172 [Peniophora sp. CONT]|nr:hypothetical protein PENSPDRAFT_661172 [Peniophora sp. CONT]
MTDVVLYILQELDTAALVCTARLSQSTRSATSIELRRRVRVVLRRYVPTAILDDFFALLQSTSSVVSGSLAFAVLSWGTDAHFAKWKKPGDLDIYVPMGATPAFTHFFTTFAQYAPSLDVKKGSHKYYPSGIRTVTTLVSTPERIPLAPVTIDIVESSNSCAMYPLQYFWGTAVNNYITSTSVISAYPRATFDRVYHRHPWALRAWAPRGVIDKYHDRGLRLGTATERLYVLATMAILLDTDARLLCDRKDYTFTRNFAKDYLVMDFASRVGHPAVARICSSACIGSSWRVVEWKYT